MEIGASSNKRTQNNIVNLNMSSYVPLNCTKKFKLTCLFVETVICIFF